MNTPTSVPATSHIAEDSPQRQQHLADLAADLLDRARVLGADQAEVACSERRGLSVNVRMGEVDTVQSTRDRSLAVTVYAGQRKGSASTADLREASLQATVEQAIAIARHTEPDPAAGLADAERMATRPRDFDDWHPWDIDADAAVQLALACEQAGRDADPRIGNSEGASVSSDQTLGVYANSHGFVGGQRRTHHAISCALIAGHGDAMQRDGWYSVALAEQDLDDATSIGRHAAMRTVARLEPRRMPTGTLPVLFSAEVARSLIGHLLAAVSGGALYRKASFLLDAAGERLFPDWLSMHEDPLLPRGLRSAWFDAEGVATRPCALVENGVLQRYVLGSYAARRLGLQSTGNAGGVHNLLIGANAEGLEALVADQSRALLVTELMGQGVNPVTGDYSRGAAGFLIENGAIAHPVDGITIAGNLRRMFAGIQAVGRDIDPRSHIRTGAMLIDGMMVAGAQ